MSDLTDLPEPDVVDGAPHPRMARQVFGQSAAEREFLDAYKTGRLHHGWLLTGPRGTGKATFAWALARFLLATPPAEDGLFGAPEPPRSLAIDPEHPVATRLRALSEPGLFLLRRGPNEKGDKLAADIRVDEVRKLHKFFGLSSADGGRRVVIVDCADDLNAQSANAILKMLEEPPARTTMLLISHQPAGLLPTIRSRCRSLRLAPLSADSIKETLAQAEITAPEQDMPALAELSAGAAGEAIRMINADGLAMYRDILLLLAELPQLNRSRLLAMSESCAGRGREGRLDLLLSLTDTLCSRIARTGALGVPPNTEIVEGEAQILQRLGSGPDAAKAWAASAQLAADRARHARSVNVDPPAIVTDLMLNLAKATR